MCNSQFTVKWVKRWTVVAWSSGFDLATGCFFRLSFHSHPSEWHKWQKREEKYILPGDGNIWMAAKERKRCCMRGGKHMHSLYSLCPWLIPSQSRVMSCTSGRERAKEFSFSSFAAPNSSDTCKDWPESVTYTHTEKERETHTRKKDTAHFISGYHWSSLVWMEEGSPTKSEIWSLDVRMDRQWCNGRVEREREREYPCHRCCCVLPFLSPLLAISLHWLVSSILFVSLVQSVIQLSQITTYCVHRFVWRKF